MIKTLTLFTGIWRATLSLPDGELPFTFQLEKNNSSYIITVINGQEKIRADEISIFNDSIFIKMPVFDSEIKAKVADTEMTGIWINYSRQTNREINFSAEAGKEFRFLQNPKASTNISGKWEVHFSEGTKDSTLSIGLFTQNANLLSGTFLTTTGDYRFLEGCVNGDSIFLSCFDGAHAYLFKAKISADKKIEGIYCSGGHWKEPWVAIKNENAELPDAFSITTMKDNSKNFSFEVLTLDSGRFIFPNKKYKNKVVIIQIMGSWCPNCMDETSFLSPFYEKYKTRNVEIIGLSFEKTNEFKRATANILKVKKRYNVTYELLVAGNREKASDKMSMLSKINGYPTTIFIDKRGNVRKIHTGFNGPATGKYFEKEKDDIIHLVEKLIRE
jgi:thiol-disulfide isomerase/thioredoxin